jgi:phosphoglycerate dehydrogenase-like enzyme
LRVVFAEEDTLFRLMEAALLRRPTPGAERALAYFFSPRFEAPLSQLLAIADRIGLPSSIEVDVCTDRESLQRALPTADILVTEREPIGAEELRLASGLRLLQKFGRDCDNIDLEAAARRGVPVAAFLRFSTLSCSDHIMALLLALARNLLPAHKAVLEQQAAHAEPRFEDSPPRTKFNWASVGNFRVLATSTLGLIGLGENSGEVAKRARAFGMRVLYFKRRPLSPAGEAKLGGAQFAQLDQLLAESDFVSLHLPWGPQTEKFVDADFLRKMKPGSSLINTGRGGLVDERALYQALKGGKLRSAALDVYRYEPVPPDCPLFELDTVLWTPHCAGGEPSYMLREVEEILSNMSRLLRGKPLAGLVANG